MERAQRQMLEQMERMMAQNRLEGEEKDRRHQEQLHTLTANFEADRAAREAELEARLRQAEEER